MKVYRRTVPLFRPSDRAPLFPLGDSRRWRSKPSWRPRRIELKRWAALGAGPGLQRRTLRTCTRRRRGMSMLTGGAHADLARKYRPAQPVRVGEVQGSRRHQVTERTFPVRVAGQSPHGNAFVQQAPGDVPAGVTECARYDGRIRMGQGQCLLARSAGNHRPYGRDGRTCSGPVRGRLRITESRRPPGRCAPPRPPSAAWYGSPASSGPPTRRCAR